MIHESAVTELPSSSADELCLAPECDCSTSSDTTMKEKILFVCILNSARSQMAEAFLRRQCRGAFEVHSAGIEPGRLNPIVVEAMREVGIDLSKNQTKGVKDFVKSGQRFAYVITGSVFVPRIAAARRQPSHPDARTRRTGETIAEGV
jgi:low molecular weight phosphotyrosine protein phosphatase